MKAGSIISEYLYPSGPKSRDLSDAEQHYSGHYITTQDKLFSSLDAATLYGLGYSESCTKRWKSSIENKSMRLVIKDNGYDFIRRNIRKNRDGKAENALFI